MDSEPGKYRAPKIHGHIAGRGGRRKPNRFVHHPHRDSPATPLAVAASRGDTAQALTLLQCGADPNLAHPRGLTALGEASATGDMDVIAILLRFGALVSLRMTEERLTPLHVAASRGHCRVMEQLLSAGADPFARDGWWLTPQERFELFCNGELPHDPRELPDVTRYSGLARRYIETQPDRIVGLLAQGLSPNCPVTSDVTGGSMDLPLAIEARRGNERALAALLEWGADPNDAFPYCDSPISVAAHTGHIAAMRGLVAAGAIPTLRSGPLGDTALHGACEHCQAEAVQLLLDLGCDPNVENAGGTTPLHAWAAASNGPEPCEDVLNMLVRVGTDLDAGWGEVDPPLAHAIYGSNWARATLLLSAGANPLAPCEEVGTVLDLARGYGSWRAAPFEQVSRKIHQAQTESPPE